MPTFDRKAAASALETTADLLEVLGAEAFRAQAYRSAARSIEALETWDEAAQNNFKGVPKVGAALAGALTEAVQTGRFGPLDEALAQVPPGVVDLLRVRGLGPKKVRSLWDGGFDSLEALREGLSDGSVTQLKGFGAKTAATLLEAVEFVLTSQGRQRMNTALDVAEVLVDAALAPGRPHQRRRSPEPGNRPQRARHGERYAGAGPVRPGRPGTGTGGQAPGAGREVGRRAD